MFKSLLRTIPSLSGNLTLACKLDEFNKINNDNYTSYVRNAIIIPLQNKYYSKKIDINIYRGKWESDIARYFLYYSDHFYDENFDYLKDDYRYVDFTSNDSYDSRNKDYEFGCKRISYNKLGYQFQFYAPFYIDNENSFPEYFQLSIQLTPTIIKRVKIYIGKENNRNYILNYLKNYVKQIDENVIHINQYNYLCTYYGIDAKNGGFIKYKYSLSDIINNYVLSTEFDEYINRGFKEGNIVMKQVIPISFLFNIDDILTKNEQKYFHYNTCKIFGGYYNAGKQLPTYDFDIDYTTTQIYVSKYNKNTFVKDNILTENIYGKKDEDYNYYLKENNITNNKLKNKVTPMFNKWKLLGSSDKYPYIINNSPNFILQNPLYNNLTYHNFPVNIDEFNAKCIVDNDVLILPVNKTNYNAYNKDEWNEDKYYDESFLAKNLSTYIRSFENISNIFNIISIQYDSDSIPDEMFLNDDNWSNVYNYTSYNHNILYNLALANELSSNRIDKFGVFMNLSVRCFDESSNNIMRSKYVIDTVSKNSFNVYVSNDIYSLNPSNIYVLQPGIKNNAFIYENGSFEIDTLGGNFIVNNKIDDNNKFYIVNSNVLYSFSSYELLKANGIEDLKFKDSELITGYIYFPLLQSDIYELACACKKASIMGLNETGIYANIIKDYYDEDDDKNQIYVSSYENTSKIHLKYLYSEIISKFEKYTQSEINEMQQKYFVYIKKTLVAKSDVEKYLEYEYIKKLQAISLYAPYVNEEISKVHEKISKEKEYKYVPMFNDNTIVRSAYFIEDKTEYTDLFIDFVNISYFSKEYYKKPYNVKPYPMYVKCTNEDQIECYIDYLLHYYNKVYDESKDINQDPLESLRRFKSDLVYDIKYVYTIKKELSKTSLNQEYYYKSNIEIAKNIWDSYFNEDANGIRTYNKLSLINDLIEMFNSVEYHNCLYFMYWVYPCSNKLIEMLPSYDDTNYKSYLLYKSNEIYTYEKYDEHSGNLSVRDISAIIGEEAIEQNYRNTEENRHSLANYIKTSTVKYYDTFPEKIEGKTIHSYDNEYTVYIENFKEYKWDEITPMNNHISSFLENNNLFNIINEKLFKYIVENIDYNNEVYSYLSDTVLNAWFSNPSLFYSQWNENESDKAKLNFTTISNLLNEIDDTKQSILSKEEFINIISFLKLADENLSNNNYYVINVKKTINERLKDICKYITEMKYVESTNLHKNALKVYYRLLEILEIVIYKKYNANKILNSKYVIKTINNVNYLYILFDFIVDNRITSYNVSHNTNNSEYIKYINDKNTPFNVIEFKKMFEYILPIYSSNIINTFLNYYKDIITIPKNNVIYNSYVLVKEKDENIINNIDSIGFDDSSTIYTLQKIKDTVINKYSLNRYFSYITPIFIETNENLKNVFNIKYKNVINNINADILYKEDLNIYKYNPLRVYSYNESGNLYYKNISQYEYKHFNDNYVYNLESEFNVSDIQLYRYEELLDRETNEIALKKFEEHICDKIKYITSNTIDKNILLFLYNKYQITFESKFERFDISNTIKLYRLTYTYKLI